MTPLEEKIQTSNVRSLYSRFGSLAPSKKSWINRKAIKGDLLYLSDEGTNDVYIYTWPHPALVGTLTGFSYPQGECVDSAGGIWVTELGTSRIVRYAHGSIKRSETLEDRGYYPMGCSVNPKSRDVAVTNLETVQGDQGNFVIFKARQAVPVTYTYPYTDYYYCTYDSAGNLFADGEYEGQGGFELTELPFNSARVIGITPNQSFDYPPGNVQWTNTTLSVGDTSKSVVYRFTVSGNSATQIGETILQGGEDPLQYWIENKTKTIVVPNAGNASVMFWRFPRGGSPFKTITNVTSPSGAVVSRYISGSYKDRP
jgi:hypothetical protein